MNTTNDLSAYELQRLVNIKRNKEIIEALGFDLNPPTKKTKRERRNETEEATGTGRVVERRNRPERKKRSTRSSPRLSNSGNQGVAKDAKDTAGSEAPGNVVVEEDPVDYGVMPKEPQHLDDAEFEVYVAMKAWRLRCCRELEIEAYKICQNRTLCEWVRRRRNNATFAISDVASEEFRGQVLEVWGIGPAKVAIYCPEMAKILDEPLHREMLCRSRTLSRELETKEGGDEPSMSEEENGDDPSPGAKTPLPSNLASVLQALGTTSPRPPKKTPDFSRRSAEL